MTSPETRLREALHEAGSVPVDSIDFDQLALRHRRRARNRWAAAGTATVAIAALVIWAGTGASPSAGKARLVPVSPPTSSPPHIVGITSPIVVDNGQMRLDPAGPPPSDTASYQRLLATHVGPSQMLGSPTEVVYGAFTDNGSGYFPSHKLGVGPMVSFFVRRPAVWIIWDHIHQEKTAYLALDPGTAKPLLYWELGEGLGEGSSANTTPTPSAPSTTASGVPTLPSSQATSGVVFGVIPPCYGPGLNMNLMPVAVVEAVQGGRVVASRSFHVSDQHDSYDLTLTPGTYVLRLRDAPHTQRSVQVLAGKRTHFDLPNLGCV